MEKAENVAKKSDFSSKHVVDTFSDNNTCNFTDISTSHPIPNSAPNRVTGSMSLQSPNDERNTVTNSRHDVKFPLDIYQHEFKGRCFMASRDIVAGEVLFRCRPYAIIPDCESRTTLCAKCLRLPVAGEPKSVLIPCPHGCTATYYCSEACRQEDWNVYHQYECDYLNDFFNNVSQDEISQIRNREKELGLKGEDKMEKVNKLGLNNYALDYMWMIMRVFIRYQHERLSSKAPSDYPMGKMLNQVDGMSFSELWDLCSNYNCFTDAKAVEFTQIGLFLTQFIAAKLLSTHASTSLDLACPEKFLSSSTIASDSRFTSMISQLSSSSSSSSSCSSYSKSMSKILLETLVPSVIEFICKEECNSFGLYTFSYKGPKFSRQPYGLGIYPAAVFFNHSCLPNVGHVTSERVQQFTTTPTSPAPSTTGDMVCYALKPIAKGEECLISYISMEASEPVSERRQVLKRVFFFTCDCPRCSKAISDSQDDPEIVKELEDVLCEVDGCKGYAVPSTLEGGDNGEGSDNNLTWSCEGCNAHKTRRIR